MEDSLKINVFSVTAAVNKGGERPLELGGEMEREETKSKQQIQEQPLCDGIDRWPIATLLTRNGRAIEALCEGSAGVVKGSSAFNWVVLGEADEVSLCEASSGRGKGE